MNLGDVSIGLTVASCSGSGEKVSGCECDPHPIRSGERGSRLGSETHSTYSGEILNSNSKSYLAVGEKTKVGRVVTGASGHIYHGGSDANGLHATFRNECSLCQKVLYLFHIVRKLTVMC